MKFFNTTQESNSLSLNWAYRDDAQDILVPSHPKYYLYSMRHIQQPKNDGPNTSSSNEEIQFAKYEMYGLSIASLNYLCSSMPDIQHEDEHDLYLQHPSKSEHSHYHKSELSNLVCVFEHLQRAHDNDILLPIPDVLSNDLRYDYPCDIQP